MAPIQKTYRQIRAVLRFFLFVAVISYFFLKTSTKYFLIRDPVEKRKALTQNNQDVCKKIMKAFNVKLICQQNIPEDEASLLVGNHLGFIDIVCLASLRSSVFITSIEMRDTPVLGQIAELGGCAYVNRRNRMKIQDELQGMVDVLRQGFRIVLYAESVASNGEQVLPFKKTLMMSAGLAGRPIRPFVFNFREVNKHPVCYEDRDSLCWYGDQTFLPAIWRSLQLNSVTCEIEFLPLIYPKPDEDRTELANRVHEAVSKKYSAFYPEMNRDHSDHSAS
jgi:1-acyl-sn-glycerol-3-phosphate acyltransferase